MLWREHSCYASLIQKKHNLVGCMNHSDSRARYCPHHTCWGKPVSPYMMLSLLSNYQRTFSIRKVSASPKTSFRSSGGDFETHVTQKLSQPNRNEILVGGMSYSKMGKTLAQCSRLQ